jgi:hypothetical protein
MHVEPAYPHSLVPRLAQHSVRRQLIQSMVHPATDDRPDYASNGTTDRTADGGGHGKRPLRRLLIVRRSESSRSGAGSRARSRTCSRSGPRSGPRTRTASGSLVRRLFVGFVSVCHVCHSWVAILRYFHTRKRHLAARPALFAVHPQRGACFESWKATA